jgi:hypothetical protein
LLGLRSAFFLSFHVLIIFKFSFFLLGFCLLMILNGSLLNNVKVSIFVTGFLLNDAIV